MKSLVVFYSLDGHTRYAAELIAGALGADTAELRPVREIPKQGFLKFFLGGKRVLFHEKPKLLDPLPETDAYDLVVIGTPVWAGSFAPPVNTFLAEKHIVGKKVALFACNASPDAGKCFENLKKHLKGSAVLGTLDFQSPTAADDESIRARVNDWTAGLIK